MKIKKLRKNVLFETKMENDNFGVYVLGKVIYDDESIDFGKVILSSDIGHAKDGEYLFDNKYIYECIVKGAISSIFDIEKRQKISSISELIRLRELYKENNPKKKLR